MACLLFVMLFPLSKVKSIPIFRVLLSICSCLLIRAQALFFQPEFCNSCFSCERFFTPLLQCRHKLGVERKLHSHAPCPLLKKENI